MKKKVTVVPMAFPVKEFVPITVKDRISFVGLTKVFGRAEFTFCPVFKAGKMVKLFITAHQQERSDSGNWVFDCEIPITEFMIESWTHKTTPPRIWFEQWCNVHKTIAHTVYVPDNTDEIKFSYHFGNQLSIRFQKKGDD